MKLATVGSLSRWIGKTLAVVGMAAAWGTPSVASAQAPEFGTPTSDERALGELLITADAEDNRPFLAILPSLSPDLEDVIVRGVVRRDFELTGLYRIIAEQKAPQGLYGFDDVVDVKAWRNTGAEVVIKVAARRTKDNKVEVFGLAYLLAAGEQPVFEKKIVVQQEDVRVTAHRVTDALLGALTGREGGFASHMSFSSKWGRNHAVFTVDADGHNITRLTDPRDTSVAPAWGPGGYLFYSKSKDYAPFQMMRLGEARALSMPFKNSIYSLAFSADGKRLAVSVAEGQGSAVYSGNADGSGMTKVSNTEIATRPVFSPNGKLVWIGGSESHGSQRVYVDGKAISPLGFSAASPTFCDTEDGIRVVYSVSLGGDRRDIVWSTETGKGIQRLTQDQGNNTYPACSPDGRMLAFFSTRKGESGLYVKSLKSFVTQKISSRKGQSLVWDRLPPPGQGVKLVPEGPDN
jgi:TolB protein